MQKSGEWHETIPPNSSSHFNVNERTNDEGDNNDMLRYMKHLSLGDQDNIDMLRYTKHLSLGDQDNNKMLRHMKHLWLGVKDNINMLGYMKQLSLDDQYNINMLRYIKHLSPRWWWVVCVWVSGWGWEGGAGGRRTTFAFPYTTPLEKKMFSRINGKYTFQPRFSYL